MRADDARFRTLVRTHGAERHGRTFDVTLWRVPGGYALELAEHDLTYADGNPTLLLDHRYRVVRTSGYVTATYLAIMAESLVDHVEAELTTQEGTP